MQMKWNVKCQSEMKLEKMCGRKRSEIGRIYFDETMDGHFNVRIPGKDVVSKKKTDPRFFSLAKISIIMVSDHGGAMVEDRAPDDSITAVKKK